MGHFVDCQIAMVPWGCRTWFRLGKLGLFRKGNVIFIAVAHREKNRGSNGSLSKYPISSDNVEVLPRAIRFKDVRKDLFFRDPIDETQLSTLLRQIKVILKREKIRQSGKADILDKLVSTIPSVNSITPNDLLITKPLNTVEINGSLEVPKQIWSRTSLIEIVLNDCNLSVVPKQLETYSSTLRKLSLSQNNISHLPRSFCCKMNYLRSLDLSNNQIETMPIEIKFFRRLVDLNVSNNRLRMLPSTFSDLRCLQDLNVAHNNLSQLPAFRMEDIKLKRLDVSYNPLDGALSEYNTFEVHPSLDEPFGYNENLLGPNSFVTANKFPKLFELSLLRVVRCDRLLRLASEESLPRTIVTTIQRDVFKCYRCNKMNMLPAYNSTDTLDYVNHVTLLTTGNFRHEMTFMKLLCRSCFDNMSF